MKNQDALGTKFIGSAESFESGTYEIDCTDGDIWVVCRHTKLVVADDPEGWPTDLPPVDRFSVGSGHEGGY